MLVRWESALTLLPVVPGKDAVFERCESDIIAINNFLLCVGQCVAANKAKKSRPPIVDRHAVSFKRFTQRLEPVLLACADLFEKIAEAGRGRYLDHHDLAFTGAQSGGSAVKRNANFSIN